MPQLPQRLIQNYTKFFIRNKTQMTEIERIITDKNLKQQNIFQALLEYPYLYEYHGQYRLREAQLSDRKLR